MISSNWTLHQRALEKHVALIKSRIPRQERGRIIVSARWEFIVRPSQVYAQERVVPII